MKILFSPSESKLLGGENLQLDTTSMLFPDYAHKRDVIYQAYCRFVESAGSEELKRIFGVKNPKEISEYVGSIDAQALMPAIRRYCGVAYDYLDFSSLLDSGKEYIYNNTIIFSNIFGPILARDMIPNYKLKQGESFDSINIEEYYKGIFSSKLDDFLADEFVLDLRAGYYDKFYKPSKPFTSVKFLKDGKVVSHYAKAYRGLLLREVAIHNINTHDELMALNIKNLKIVEIKHIGKKCEVVFDIVDL